MSTYYFIPTKSVFGAGCVEDTGEIANSLGMKKALIVTDKFLSQSGVANRIADILKKANVGSVIFDEVVPNPTDKNVEAGEALYKKEQCDAIITLGGGSSHDCGKGIALVCQNGGKIQDFEGIDVSTQTLMPLLSINTTAGTAAEMTRFAIITDTTRHVKMAIIDWRVTPLIAINDAEMMATMPSHLTAATGMDALTHAIEAYVSTAHNPLTDCAALKAIQLITEYLPRAVANGEDLDAREQMAYAQYLAGVAFNNASLGYVHAMAHQLGGVYNLPHGVCNALLLPFVCKFNLIGATKRFVDIAKAMGIVTKGKTDQQIGTELVKFIKDFGAELGIPANLAELGVKESDFKLMAENAKKDACQLTNPRKASLEEVIEMYLAAFQGTL
ncbi:iron-containing alcohol dehydrogenase [Actinobacillus delphinicola]|uniref:Iron-containing alcohol dehydrogenase n=1 Tax=Actinobacillus delphinicola TaxID=51161 RepID=A0A448TUS4_9PAST|nr:iron-containing alcohol dehydrogenase [Actinobacillus delphinicola]VEJ09705.1 iron-containing alcohol dehydrogenase [Actinobacillus delphinicola]